MSAIDQVQSGIDFIEAHLEEDISLCQIAAAAHMSQWHFQRVFKALTGETLKAYIRARRLAGALHRLLETDTRIIEIATAAGFESQEAFTRAFRQAFDMTPAQYRKIGQANQFIRKVQLTPEYLASVNKNIGRTPELREIAPMTLVGLATDYFGEGSEKNNMAQKLPGLWASFLQRWRDIPGATGDVAYGVIEQSLDDERLTYTAAAPVQGPASPPPSGMQTLQVERAHYAVFEHRGAASRLDHTVSYAYATWLLASGRRHSGGPDLEIYGSGYHPTADNSVIHYAIPLR